jgi:uncharacterized protein (TIGR02147 family)
MDTVTQISIFNYHDYRAYLSDFYRHKKDLNSRFSYRLFARKAGYKSPSLFLGIVSGQNRLTEALLPKFVVALGLDRSESRYFEHMVGYCHASGPEAKQHYFDQMVQLLPPRAKSLTAKQKAYYRNWCNVVIREAMAVVDIGDDPSPLARLLLHKVPRQRIVHSLALLRDLGLIQKNPAGFWKAVDPVVSGSRESDLISIYDFREKMMDFARKALWDFPPEERNISCLTGAVSQAMAGRVHRKVDQFRREIAELLRADRGEERVYQLNIQWFPLTKRRSHASQQP